MKYLLIISFSLIQINLFAGGGWTPEKGNGFFSLTERMIYGRNYFNSQGQIIGSPTLAAFTTNLYGEYGFTDRLAGILYSPFLTSLSRASGMDSLNNTFIQDKAIGFGDVDLGIKYAIWTKKINVAASLIVGLPTGNFFAGQTKTLHLGDNEFNQLIKIDASKGFNHGIFSTLFFGFNNRTNGFSDELHYGGELGISKNKFIGILKVYARNSLFNETPRKDSPIPGIYSDNLEYFSLSPQILYKVKGNVGITAEAGFALNSRNIIAAPSFTLGVFLDLKR